MRYTIKPGDTLTAIASNHGVTVAAIAKLNGIADANRIYAGRTLEIPGVPPVQYPSSAPQQAPFEIEVTGGTFVKPVPVASGGFMKNLRGGDFALLAIITVLLGVFVAYQPEPTRKRRK